MKSDPQISIKDYRGDKFPPAILQGTKSLAGRARHSVRAEFIGWGEAADGLARTLAHQRRAEDCPPCHPFREFVQSVLKIYELVADFLRVTVQDGHGAAQAELRLARRAGIEIKHAANGLAKRPVRVAEDDDIRLRARDASFNRSSGASGLTM